MKYSKHIPIHERPVITALLKEILATGAEITINDGYEDVITTRKLNELRGALGGTGEDYVVFEGGWFYLIYNNGSKEDPVVVISNFTDNEFCDDLWYELVKKYS